MSQSEKCWFTEYDADVRKLPDLPENPLFDSTACGRYYISMSLDIYRAREKSGQAPRFGTPQGRFNCARRCVEVEREGKIAYWVYRSEYEAAVTALKGKNVEVCVVEDYLSLPIDHSEKPFLILESFANRLATVGAYSTFQLLPGDLVWARISGGPDEIGAIFYHLLKSEFLNFDSHLWSKSLNDIGTAMPAAKIQFKVGGWEFLRQRNSFPNTNKVFIATAFKWPDEEEATRGEVVAAIKRACESLGYEADVVSQNHTGFITDRIISEIRASRFMVAEFTYNNRGVYFEAGLARGLGRDVFHIVREGFNSQKHEDDKDGKKLHFDVQQVNYRTWIDPKDLEVTLKEWIGARLGRFDSSAVAHEG